MDRGSKCHERRTEGSCPGVTLRLAGFPVRIEATFFFVAAILGQGRPGELLLGWIAVVFVSILVHEMGHAVTLRAFGDTPRITLHAFGGATYPTKPLPLAKDVISTLAGSFTQLTLLGLPAMALRSSIEPTDLGSIRWWIVLSDLVWVSVGWALLNLLPVLPLDGGLVARRLLVYVRPQGGERIALMIAIVTAAAGAALAFARGLIYAGAFALYFVGANVAHLGRARPGIRVPGVGAPGRRTSGGGQRHRPGPFDVGEQGPP